MSIRPGYSLFGFLLVLGFFSVAVCFFEDTRLVGKITELKPYESIKNGQDDQLAVVFFWHEDSPLTLKYQDLAYEFAQANDKLFSIYQLDCEFFSEDEISICGGENSVQRLPIIRLYVPSQENVNDVTNQPHPAQQIEYNGAADVKELSMFAKQHMPNFAIRRPSWQDMESNILPEISLANVILFTDKQETAPLFKAVSAIYRDRLRCIEIHSNQTEVIQHFQVKKFPTLMMVRVNDQGQAEGVPYQDQLKINKIIDFLNQYALGIKVSPKKIKRASYANQDQSSFQSGGNGITNEEDEKQTLGKIIIEPLDYFNYFKKTLKEEGIVLIHVIESKEDEHPAFEELSTKLDQLSKYFELVVDSDKAREFATTVLGVTTFPSIKLLPFGKSKKKAQASDAFVFKEEKTAERIIQDIDESTPNNIETIPHAQMFQFAVDRAIQQEKNIQIYFHKTPRIPLTYRVIAQEAKYVKAGIKFFTYGDPSQDVLGQFQISSLPKVGVLFKYQHPDKINKPDAERELQGAVFNGKMIYKDYTKYLRIFILNQDEESADSEITKKKVLEIKSQENLDTACNTTTTTKFCFIALLNGHPTLRPVTPYEDDDEEYDFYDYDESKASKLEQQVKILHDVKNKLAHNAVNFAWIDALCHGNLLEALEIQEDTIPNYIMYNPSSKQFSLIVGRYDMLNIDDFSQKAIQGKVHLQTLPNELKIEQRNCLQQHEMLQKRREEYERELSKKDALDEEIKREILEEERIRKEKIQAELKAQGQHKEGKSKGKKHKKTDL